jgi:RIO-like serine/threonine protein kinase
VQTSGVIEQEQLAFVRPPSSSDDESLLERWKKRHRLSKGEVKVLRVMARMCREAGGDYCYVKIPQLMADAELKERQTQLVLRSLRALGLVEKLADYSNADRIGTKYRVSFKSE